MRFINWKKGSGSMLLGVFSIFIAFALFIYIFDTNSGCLAAIQTQSIADLSVFGSMKLAHHHGIDQTAVFQYSKDIENANVSKYWRGSSTVIRQDMEPEFHHYQYTTTKEICSYYPAFWSVHQPIYRRGYIKALGHFPKDEEWACVREGKMPDGYAPIGQGKDRTTGNFYTVLIDKMDLDYNPYLQEEDAPQFLRIAFQLFGLPVIEEHDSIRAWNDYFLGKEKAWKKDGWKQMPFTPERAQRFADQAKIVTLIYCDGGEKEYYIAMPRLDPIFPEHVAVAHCPSVATINDREYRSKDSKSGYTQVRFEDYPGKVYMFIHD